MLCELSIPFADHPPPHHHNNQHDIYLLLSPFKLKSSLTELDTHTTASYISHINQTPGNFMPPLYRSSKLAELSNLEFISSYVAG